MNLRLKLKPEKPKKKLEEYRALLLERREKLAAELRQSTNDFINDEETYSDAVDQAAADTGRTLALRMKNRERTTLAQLDEALNRLENGSYGDCESCEEPIGDARLHAFPLTTLCIECKATLESEEQRFYHSR